MKKYLPYLIGVAVVVGGVLVVQVASAAKAAPQAAAPAPPPSPVDSDADPFNAALQAGTAIAMAWLMSGNSSTEHV